MEYDFDAARLEQNPAESTKLPGIYNAERLEDLNMEQELVKQYNAVRHLQDEVMMDPETPANQKAQVANSVASTIKMLVETQEKYYSQERFKRIESLLIRTLKTWPQEQAAEFIDEYAKVLSA